MQNHARSQKMQRAASCRYAESQKAAGKQNTEPPETKEISGISDIIVRSCMDKVVRRRG